MIFPKLKNLKLLKFCSLNFVLSLAAIHRRWLSLFIIRLHNTFSRIRTCTLLLATIHCRCLCSFINLNNTISLMRFSIIMYIALFTECRCNIFITTTTVIVKLCAHILNMCTKFHNHLSFSSSSSSFPVLDVIGESSRPPFFRALEVDCHLCWLVRHF